MRLSDCLSWLFNRPGQSQSNVSAVAFIFSISVCLCLAVISVRSRLKTEETTVHFVFTKDLYLTHLTHLVQVDFAPSFLSPSAH